MSDLPIIMTEAGAQPTSPKTLLANLISRVAQKVPGYTANLPPGLITDLASTATGAIALIDQARVDLINSVSPYHYWKSWEIYTEYRKEPGPTPQCMWFFLVCRVLFCKKASRFLMEITSMH